MRLGQTASDLQGDVQGLRGRQGAAIEALFQGLAFVEGHREIELTLDRLADLVEGADVGVIESRSRPRLVQEACLRPGIGCQHWREEFESDRASQERVLGAVDDAHPTGPDQAEEPVSRCGAGRLRRAPESRQALLVGRSPNRRGSSCRRDISDSPGHRISGIWLADCPLSCSHTYNDSTATSKRRWPMKKNDFKKLRLSRETLKALTIPDVQKVRGGGSAQVTSCQSECRLCPDEPVNPPS